MASQGINSEKLHLEINPAPPLQILSARPERFSVERTRKGAASALRVASRGTRELYAGTSPFRDQGGSFPSPMGRSPHYHPRKR